MASQRLSPVTAAAPNAAMASTRPSDAAAFSPKMTTRSESLVSRRARRTARPWRAAAARGCSQRGAALENQREAENGKPKPDALDGFGPMQFVNAFVNRKHAARREQQQGDDERPEVHVAAVAQRVPRVGRPPRLPQPDQQQHLIGAVRAGVNRLGQQRPRTGEKRRHGLGDRDGDVDQQRLDDV